MNPKECLRLACAAVLCGDDEAFAEHMDNYRQWRARGGFEPDVSLTGDELEELLLKHTNKGNKRR